MSRAEIRAGVSLAGIFGLRMLGLFLILPVFAVHAAHLSGGDNLTLVGAALGAYGLTQAVLQIPFGIASDRWGRRPLIIIGLLIFAAGSFLAASAQDIWTAIAGRSLQGAGAISSVVVALAADLTREGHRTKVMAMIGATIGLAFALSLVAAPVLYRSIGMGGLFSLTGALSLAAIWVVLRVPDVPVHVHASPGSSGLAAALDPELLRLNAGIFILHMVQMAMFVVVPGLLIDAGLALPEHWKFYLPVVLASFALMAPAVLLADRRNQAKAVMLGSIFLFAGSQVAFAFAGSNLVLLAGFALAFFAAFNVLEAIIPSLVTRIAPARARGAAIGVYNTTQTLGLFAGGFAGGWVAEHWGASGVFGACAALAVLWLALAAPMRPVGPRPVNDRGDPAFSEQRHS